MKKNKFSRAGVAAAVAAGSLSVAMPSANALTVIDLVTGNTGTANSTIYNWVDAQTTGTGVIEPFLRIQNNSGTEEGYNTSIATASSPWETKQGSWTHDLLLSDLVIVNIGGTNYFEFLLDLNENNNATQRYISLNNVQIFSRSTAITSPDEDLSILGTLRYNMDQVGGLGAANDVTVELDYTRNAGSGAGDMLMYVPTSLFAGVSASDYIYFYSLFGNPNEVDAGFEEWALRTCTSNCGTQVPEPTTLALFGLGLLGLGAARRRTK